MKISRQCFCGKMDDKLWSSKTNINLWALFFSLAHLTQILHILTPYICCYCTNICRHKISPLCSCKYLTLFWCMPNEKFRIKESGEIDHRDQNNCGAAGHSGSLWSLRRFCLAAQGQVKIERLCVGLNDAPLNRSPPQSVADEAVHGSNLISCRTPLLYWRLYHCADILLASPPQPLLSLQCAAHFCHRAKNWSYTADVHVECCVLIILTYESGKCLERAINCHWCKIKNKYNVGKKYLILIPGIIFCWQNYKDCRFNIYKNIGLCMAENLWSSNSVRSCIKAMPFFNTNVYYGLLLVSFIFNCINGATIIEYFAPNWS